MTRIDENTVLYLRGDSFLDLSFNNIPVSHSNIDRFYIENNRIVSNAGDGSVSISTNLNLPGDFTYEWWVNIDSHVGLNTFLNYATSHYYLIGHYTSTDGPYGCWIGTEVHNWNILGAQELGAPPLNTDTHYAFVRKDGNYYVFRNGVLLNTTTAQIVSMGLNGMTIGNCSGKQQLWNMRISNVARWVTNFIPPSEPYTAAYIDNVSWNDNILSFIASSDSINERIQKIQIIRENVIIEEITDGRTNIEYTLDAEYGMNEIEIRAYYFDDYYISYNTSYFKNFIEKLDEHATVLEMKKKIKELHTAVNFLKDELKNILDVKNVNVNGDCTLTDLIYRVRYLPGISSSMLLNTDYININGSFHNHTKTILDGTGYNGSSGFSITGTSDTDISYMSKRLRCDFVIDLTNVTSISYYCMKGANHGHHSVYISDGMPEIPTPEFTAYYKHNFTHYNDLPESTWVRFEIDTSYILGEKVISFIGGWYDSTGNTESNTQYSHIELNYY